MIVGVRGGLAQRAKWFKGGRAVSAVLEDTRQLEGVGRLLHRFGSLRSATCVEREAGRGFLWLPVGLVAGIGVYFSLPIEPGAGVIMLALGALATLTYTCWRERPWAAAMFGAALAGFILAKCNAILSGTPLVASVTEVSRFEGVIENIDRRGRRSAALTVRIVALEDLPVNERPKRIVLTVPVSGDLRIGRFVSGSLRLFPLLTPVAPGGYDHARSQWLRGIGATGRVLNSLEVDKQRSAGPILEVKHRLEVLRELIGGRISQALPGDVGAFATALVTGDRSSVSASTTSSLQASGLAHVISISGLHMTLVAGGFFWLVRALLALSPSLAANWPIKKWAALGALTVGAFYLLLSGSEVPTQRSYIMLAIMFGAILFDRPALSLRNVAMAALVVLLLRPASALDAGFQMSFLAVAGLMSFYEAARDRNWLDTEGEVRSSLVPRSVRRLIRGIVFAAATSLIAGLCTGPVAAFHFNRIAVYGLLANLLALPVVSFIVMPMALGATLLIPLGLEPLPLAAMGFGLDAVMAISDWTASLPGAQIVAASYGSPAVLLMISGLLWCCIFKTGVRWLGMLALLAGLLIAGWRSEPDILVERTARNVAIRNSAGELVPALARRSTFAVERWLLSDGDGAKPIDAHRRQGWSCKPEVCLAVVKGRRVAYLTEEAEQDFSCPEVDLVVAAFPLRRRCRNITHRVDRFDVWRHGAHAIFIADDSLKMSTVREHRGLRPWVAEPKPRKRPADPPARPGSKDS